MDIREELKNSGAKPIKFVKGDFLLLYKGQKDLYDCIVTLFYFAGQEQKAAASPQGTGCRVP